MMWRMSGRGLARSRAPSAAFTSALNSTETLPSDADTSLALARTACTQSSRILSLRGQAGVVSSMSRVTSSPSSVTALTILRVTRSLPRSGSRTVCRASMICSLLRAMGR